MTLHGHTRIELTDVHTGAVEVVESDNLITNAVSDIFNGYGGSLNKAMLLWRGDQGYTNAPKDLVTMFYGGLLLYDTPPVSYTHLDVYKRQLYDRARIWAEQRELVDAGLLRPELALAWYFDLPHETEAELAEIRRRFMGDAGRAQ